jgi:hypothetical protein
MPDRQLASWRTTGNFPRARRLSSFCKLGGPLPKNEAAAWLWPSPHHMKQESGLGAHQAALGALEFRSVALRASTLAGGKGVYSMGSLGTLGTLHRQKDQPIGWTLLSDCQFIANARMVCRASRPAVQQVRAPGHFIATVTSECDSHCICCKKEPWELCSSFSTPSSTRGRQVAFSLA